MNTWNLRTEILMAGHRWYWVVASFLIGALLGWIISLLWPAPFRAVQDVYVGLNAYRVTRDLYIAEFADEQFRNLDDYKNWQMGQLNSLALSDEFLSETLIQLQGVDQSWQRVTVPELRSMLAIGWRNTGDWHFSAQAENPNKAFQAVSVWSEVVTEKAALAVEAARQLVVIDARLQAVSQDLTALNTRQVLLQETQSAVQKWRELLVSNWVGKSLPPANHWALVSQVANAASWKPGWFAITEDTPVFGSSSEEYLSWLDQVDAMIESELSTLPVQIDKLTREQESLNSEYRTSADESKAISANLNVEILNNEQPLVTELRKTGTMMMLGGLLGVLVWGFGWLVQVTRRTE